MDRCVAIILILCGLCPVAEAGSPGAEQYGFRIYAEQNGRKHYIRPRDSTLRLAAAPFDLFIIMDDPCGIYVSISADSALYTAAGRGKPLIKKMTGGAAIMAESNFNTDSDLIVSDRYFCYWFVDPEIKWNRFNEVIRKRYMTLCKRTVHRLFYEETRKSQPIARARGNLYVVMLLTEQNERTGKATEVTRLRFRISWSGV